MQAAVKVEFFCEEEIVKRSHMNEWMRQADAFFKACHIFLPPFAYWAPSDWARAGLEVEDIVDNRLGWDMTDYGLNDLARYGLLLFTLRNGSPASWQRGLAKHYAEKVMIAEAGQTHQMHMHARKMEDIINRAGGVLAIELYNATAADQLADSPVRVNLDGVWRTLSAGTIVRLHPGESITLTPRLFHRFWAEHARVLIGEVSSVNDDQTDNFFFQPIGTGRFSSIEEDAPARYVLCTEYEKFWRARS